ncbi:hypothetical protein ES703_67192 [subsurface metagenome]
MPLRVRDWPAIVVSPPFKMVKPAMVVSPLEPITLNLSAPISKVPDPEALVKFN